MINPWTDNKAFAPMYDEDISIKGERENLSINTSMKVICFSDMTGDPLSESAISSDREDVVMSIEPLFWKYVEKIQRGDTIFRPFNNKTYKVQNVIHDYGLGWIIKAREV